MDCSTPGLPVPHLFPEFMSIESVMPSNHLILCHPLLLLPSVFPSIRVFSNESVLCLGWPEYWSSGFSISPSKLLVYDIFNCCHSKERTHLTLLRGVDQSSMCRKTSFSEGDAGNAFQILPKKEDILASRPRYWQGCAYCGGKVPGSELEAREGDSSTSASSSSVLLSILTNTDGSPMLVCLIR